MSKNSALLSAFSLLLITSTIQAHGGSYRGPVPGTQSPPRVAGGGAEPPKTATTPTKKALGIQQFDRAWFVWWEYHKAAYINRDRRIAGDETALGPAGATSVRRALDRGYVDQTLVPAFVRVLAKGSGNRELITGSLIGLARLRPKDEVTPAITAYLKQNREYAETAALSLGICASPSAFPVLLGLATNDKSALKWIRSSRVSYRIRSFSLYGLGIWCRQSADNYARSQALAAVIRIIDVESRSRRRKLRSDTLVAAFHALRLIVGGSQGTSGDLMRKDGLRCLVDYVQDAKNKDMLVRSHVVNALGETLGRNQDPTGQVRKLLVSILEDRKEPAIVQQSAVISLGRMGRPEDRELVDRLAAFATKGKDGHARNLALMALARIASDEARTALLGMRLRQGGQWQLLALAVLDVERRRRSGNVEVDKTIGESLMAGIGSSRGSIGPGSAVATALGIHGYLPAVALLQKALDPKLMTHDNAWLVQSLGLLGASTSADEIRRMANRALAHPVLLTRIATALAQLGDEGIGAWLVKQLRSRKYTIEKASVALALGNVGGVAEADQLIKVLQSTRQEDMVRGFAAIALGMMGEPTRLPWHYDLLSGINYIAQTETLVGSGNGVLEIF